jgi:hypothetical protein
LRRELLLACLPDRPALLDACVHSIRQHLTGWHLNVAAQDFANDDLERFGPGDDVHQLAACGPHRAKLAALRRIDERPGPYVVCSIDDDMEFTADTSLEPVVLKVGQPDTGLVSAGWVQHPNRLAKHKLVDVFVKQPIVYTGGGLLLGHRTARDVILRMPDVDFYDDNAEWSLACYVAGLTNYRWRGSVTIHRIGSKGGRRTWLRTLQEERVLSDPELLGYREWHAGAGQLWRIGDSRDLTAEAHRRHATAKGDR